VKPSMTQASRVQRLLVNYRKSMFGRMQRHALLALLQTAVVLPYAQSATFIGAERSL
jgi:hypothetical protein